MTRIGSDSSQVVCDKRKQICEVVASRLERAVQENDSMAIDKTLRFLVQKLRSRELEHQAVAATGIGPILGKLKQFDGDADIRDLANACVQEIGKLQLADYIR